MRFHCVIKSLHRIYSITHEEAETKSNYSSYKKMDLINQPLNGMRDFTSERFRREIAHVQEDGARMREHRRDVTETCRAYTSPTSFRIDRKAFSCVPWFWTGMGTAEGMETRDFALERFRREGCNLLRERFFLQFYTSTRPSAQPLDPTTGYGDVAFVPLRLTILDR